MFFHRSTKMSAIFLLLFLFSLNLSAGIVMIEMDGSKTYISHGKMKEINKEEGLIMNSLNGEVVYFNPDKQIYTRGKASEFCEAVSQIMDQMMAALPPEYKEMMGVGKNMPAPEVEIISDGDGGAIAGYNTEKYTVNADGELYETIWIATDTKLTKEIESLVEMFAEFEKCINSMDFGSPPVEMSDAYIDLMKKGLTLKSIQHEFGEENVTVNTIKIETRDISDSEFQVPSGFTEVSIVDFFSIEMEDSEEY